jgi:hypothetical protein
MASIFEVGIGLGYIMGVGDTLGQARSHNDYEHQEVKSHVYQMLTRSTHMGEYHNILKYILQLCTDNPALKPQVTAVLQSEALTAHVEYIKNEKEKCYDIFSLFTPVYLRNGGNCRIHTRMYPLYPAQETLYATGGDADYDLHFLYQYAYASKKNQQWKCKNASVTCDAYSMIKLGCNPRLNFGVVVYFYNRIIHVARLRLPMQASTELAVIARFKPHAPTFLIDVCITENECVIATRNAVYVYVYTQSASLIQHVVEHDTTTFVVESVHMNDTHLFIGTTLGQLYTLDKVTHELVETRVIPFVTPILKICTTPAGGGAVLVQTLFEVYIFNESGANQVVYRNRLLSASLEPNHFIMLHFNGAIEIISLQTGAKYIIPYPAALSLSTVASPWYNGISTASTSTGKLVAIYPNLDIRVISIESIKM